MSGNSQKGFTIVEILIAMVLVTFLTMAALDMFGPWMLLKSKIDTDRKMQDVKTALTEAYRKNALSIDTNSGQSLVFSSGTFNTSTTTPVAGGGVTCTENAGFDLLRNFLSNGVHDAVVDGFGSPLCVFISNRLKTTVDGVDINYHTVAILSMGSDSVSNSTFNPATGELDVKGDDYGTIVNGFGIQYEGYTKTLDRMDKIANLYSSYFTARYLSSVSRDVSVDYFSTAYDPSGSVPSTNTVSGNVLSWVPVRIALASLGASDMDSRTPYEDTSGYLSGRNNDIFINNFDGCVPINPAASCPNGNAPSVDCLCVRSPANGISIPPYTAILSAQLPGGSIISKTVVGHY